MRWFWIATVIVILAAVDKAYMNSENTRAVISAARSMTAVVVRKSEDLVAYLRR
jgi:hypothetical protein